MSSVLFLWLLFSLYLQLNGVNNVERGKRVRDRFASSQIKQYFETKEKIYLSKCDYYIFKIHSVSQFK